MFVNHEQAPDRISGWKVWLNKVYRNSIRFSDDRQLIKYIQLAGRTILLIEKALLEQYSVKLLVST